MLTKFTCCFQDSTVRIQSTWQLAKFIDRVQILWLVYNKNSAFDCFKGIVGTAILKSITTTFSGSYFAGKYPYKFSNNSQIS